MRVRLARKNRDEIAKYTSEFDRNGRSHIPEEMFAGVELGKEYNVLAVGFFDSGIQYLLDRLTFEYAYCFDVVDDSIPPDWKIHLVDNLEEIYPFVKMFLGYPEVAKNGFYTNLILNRDTEAVKQFKLYRDSYDNMDTWLLKWQSFFDGKNK
ncbi:MAG: hypothetical protein WAX38_04555 [Minisyncoccia bacterium]